MNNQVKEILYVVSVGELVNVGEYVRFSFSAPSYVKRLLGINVFSPQLANLAPENEDVHVSVMVNNEERVILSQSFSLGFFNEDDNIQIGKMIDVNIKINKSEYISGYVEKLAINRYIPSVEVKLHFKFETIEGYWEK